MKVSVRYFDHFVFEWCKRSLKTATPDDIAAFYVEKFIVKNTEYIKQIMPLYKLPNDFIKMHKQICNLADMSYEGKVD